MQFNWGTGIVIAFSAFAIFIGNLVFKSLKQNVDLVSKDYYSKEIKYQDQIDKMNNASDKSKIVLCIVEGDKVRIQFPDTSDVTGSLYFLRPSDAKMDVIEPVAVVGGEQFVDISKFKSGKYKLQIDWESHGKKYYSEKVIVF